MTVKDINNIPKLAQELNAILDRVGGKAGAYMEAKLVEMISTQWTGWAPLAEETIARKGSSQIYFDKGELQGLITHVVKGTMPKVIEVGIFNHEKGTIAHFMEFGTERMPERPLFRLVFSLEQEKIQDLILTELDKELKQFEV